MKIRGRLIVLLIQLAILVLATYWANGVFISSESWFVAGLLTIIINPQLLEPFYPRPADIVGNSLLTLVICVVSDKTVLKTGWTIFIFLLIAIIILSLISMIFGSQKQQTKLSNIARASKIISSEATALRVYSIVFWLLLIEKYPMFNKSFWIISSAWLLIVVITIVDWKNIWSTLTTFTGNVTVEGIISPSVLLVSSSNIPMPGKLVTIKTNAYSTQGVVVSRIRRIDDVWGQISIASQDACEAVVNSGSILISEVECEDELIGSIEEGSTVNILKFYPTKGLEIGDVITIIQDDKEIMYQVLAAKIHQKEIKGGSYYLLIAEAVQIGIFNSDTYRIEQLRWIPNFGSKLIRKENKPTITPESIPETWLKIGTILGTEVPIYIDSEVAGEGHLAILGMTKMGKSTFAARYCNFLGKSKCVTILDQTGEYVNKKRLPIYDSAHLQSPNGVKVLEPNIGAILPDFAKNFLQQVIAKGRQEYNLGQPVPRVILFDEAHQFIPEPALLGFNSAGRESSIFIGNLFMQVRKYGLSIILISQRTAVVAKSALSQCENIIAFKSTDHTGLEYLESVVGNQVSEILPKLRQGEALVFGPAFSSEGPIVIKVQQD
jgi:hypothetical protein